VGLPLILQTLHNDDPGKLGLVRKSQGMGQILIGDVGSTSADWALIGKGQQQFFATQGHNPTVHPQTQLRAMVAELAKQIKEPISGATLRYYGSGVTPVLDFTLMDEPFHEILDIQGTTYASDLLGAAHALCGDSPGLVCILGTGSNACIYDGTRITYQSPSLGYLLGDEGSGCDIGRRLVQAYYYGEMPEELAKIFAGVVSDDRNAFLQLLYKAERPNQRLAALARFAVEHQEDPFVVGLVQGSLQSFITQHLRERSGLTRVHFVGSIAYFFSKEISHLLNIEGLILAAVLRKPIEQLARYHVDHMK